MKRIYLYGMAIVVIIIVIVGFILSLPEIELEGESEEDEIVIKCLEWDVEIGDSFHYEITSWVTGILMEGFQYYILDLNGTTIEANITSLPSVDEISDVDSFLSNIVQTVKVHCNFVNGTELASGSNNTISNSVSACLLPIGNWSVLDLLFEDELPGWEPDAEYYASKLDNTHFVFECLSCGPYDDPIKWTSEISLENGVPINITWLYSHGGSTRIYMVLSLVGL